MNSYNEIVFCGYGEPACRWDDMMWLCDRIKEHGSHFIRINTNGLANLITGRRAALEEALRRDWQKGTARLGFDEIAGAFLEAVQNAEGGR